MSAAVHPAAPHHLPGFIVAPGETDILMVATGIVLLAAVLLLGNLFLWLHTLPERTAHKSKKFQFEIVAILGLLALFTHIHLFWVAGLLLAFIDLPEFGKPLDRIAGSLETIAGGATTARASDAPAEAPVPAPQETIVRPVPVDGAAKVPDKPVLAPVSARS